MPRTPFDAPAAHVPRTRNVPRGLIAVVLSLAFCAPASAQPKGRKVAFLVGVGTFRHDLPDLSGSPQKDVAALAAVLREGGFEVVSMTDREATKAAVERRYQSVLDGGGNAAKALGKNDLLLVAVCSHGFTLPQPGGKPDAPFFAAHDSRTNAPDTMVPLNGLIGNAKGFGPTTLFLIDACREIKDADRGAVRGVEGTQVSLPKGMAILFSCGRGQFAHQNEKAGGHGLFTFAVLKVLKGEGGLKDRVSWSGLVYEVENTFQSDEFRRMIPAGKPQRPFVATGELDFTELLKIDSLADDLARCSAALYRGSYSENEYMRAEATARAAAWKVKADAGSATAQALYGLCCAAGQGAPKDEKAAVAWFEKAAAQGHGLGLANLGVMHQQGRGVTKDEAKAAEWYQKSADAGEPDGWDNLGQMHLNGWGVPKDETKGYRAFLKAAEAGHPGAMRNVGVCLRDGLGVGTDEAGAVKWFRRSADAGHEGGMSSVGYMYETGKGVPKDVDEALRWYRKAAARGDKYGTDAVKRLEKK